MSFYVQFLSLHQSSPKFVGSLTFTYNQGHGECKEPVSKIESSTDDSKLSLNLQACPDVPGTESRGLLTNVQDFFFDHLHRAHSNSLKSTWTGKLNTKMPTFSSDFLVEELSCLATFRDGFLNYLVGLVSYDHAASYEERYRCFVYEKISSNGKLFDK